MRHPPVTGFAHAHAPKVQPRSLWPTVQLGRGRDPTPAASPDGCVCPIPRHLFGAIGSHARVGGSAPLRAIYRRVVARGEMAVNPTMGLELPAVRSKLDRIAPR